MIEAQTQRILGRAKNALQEYLVRKLLVPKVFWDAEWGGGRADVLAIDRAGSGDVHAARLVPPKGRYIDEGGMVEIARASSMIVQEFGIFPSQYRYVAVVSEDPDTRRYRPSEQIVRETLAEDGVGRIGILHVDFSEGDPAVHEVLKAERFRSSKEIVELADEFAASHTPNWEIRE